MNSVSTTRAAAPAWIGAPQGPLTILVGARSEVVLSLNLQDANDGDNLSIKALSSDDSIAAVDVRGQQGNISLVITGLRPGTVTISWEAKDPYGANITRTMQVTVEPPPAISSPGFRLALAGIGVAAAAAIVAAVLVQRRRRGAQTAVGAQAGPAFPAAPAAGAPSFAPPPPPPALLEFSPCPTCNSPVAIGAPACANCGLALVWN